jgi:predicted lipoprotein with Yx(FWY)xxD motif
MQHHSLSILTLTAAVVVGGCSGGGGSSSMPAAQYSASTAAPTATPAAAPSTTPAPNSTVLATQSIDGGAAFVTSSDLPVYVSAADSKDVSNCTGGCLSVWPAVAPPSGALPAPWSSFKRSDNGKLQLAYNGSPLYTFAQDSPGVSSGNGVNGFSLARPLAAATAPTATPDPTASPAPTATPASTATPYNPY